ncbi:MAG: ABC transporter permease subunit [bacterium]|nr:ABC transporter permease subunit [bacterium]MDE0353259.1 ABC transporter permease subunit [bacterium]
MPPTHGRPATVKDPSSRRGLEGDSGDSRLRTVRSLARRFLVAIWPYVLVIGAWQAWVTLGGVHRLVIPEPGAVAFDIWSAPGEYWSYGWRTVLEAAAGLAIGTAIGVAAAIAVWFSRVLRGLLTTSMILLYSAPIVATIPIMAKVLGYSATTVLAIAAIVSMFPTFVLVNSGLLDLPAGSVDVFRSLGAPRTVELMRLALPAAMPNFLVAFRLNAAVAFIAAVIGEYLTGVRGLGWLFALSFSRFDVDRAWGAAMVIIALSILSYALASRVEERGIERWT